MSNQTAVWAVQSNSSLKLPTDLVALRLARSYIGIDLHAEYISMSDRRIREDAPLFRQGEQG